MYEIETISFCWKYEITGESSHNPNKFGMHPHSTLTLHPARSTALLTLPATLPNHSPFTSSHTISSTSFHQTLE